MKKKFAIGLLLSIFLASFAMVGSAGATPLSLADVVTAGSITIGDKVFSGWTADSNSAGTASSFTAASITFVPLATPALDPGFELSGMPMSVGANGSQDLTLSYTVAVAPGGALIKDASLSFVGGVLGVSPYASVQIIENVYTSNGGTLLAQLVVGQSGPTDIVSATANFAPQSSIYVVKDIGVNGDGVAGGSAFVSQLTDRYSEVPVPASLLLFGPGLLGLVGIRKRLKA